MKLSRRFLASALAFVLTISSLGALTPETVKADTGNGTAYYVSNSGNDTNSGLDPSHPWQTIAKVNTITFQPGDKVLFKKGDIWAEGVTLTPQGDGVEGNPITIGDYGAGDSRPVINGSGRISALRLNNQSHWQIQDIKVMNDSSLPYRDGTLDSGTIKPDAAGAVQPHGNSNFCVEFTSFDKGSMIIAPQTFALKAGVQYTLTSWVQGNGTVAARVRQVASGNVFDANIVEICNYQMSTNGNITEWKKVTTTFTPANDSPYTVLDLIDWSGMGSTGHIYISDISIRPTSQLTDPITELINPNWQWNFGANVKEGRASFSNVGVSTTTGRVRSGIEIHATSHEVNDITIENVEITQVDGFAQQYMYYNAGIIVGLPYSNGSYSGNHPIDNLTIDNCYIHDLNTAGIISTSNWDAWNETIGFASVMHKNMVIKDTTVLRAGTEGIAIGFAQKPVIENCTVLYSSNNPSATWNGGIWVWLCDSSVMQYNEVGHTQYSGDSQAFDIDIQCYGTHLIQYNYSHDNEGGFFLVMTPDSSGETFSKYASTVARYNISVNDHGNNISASEHQFPTTMRLWQQGSVFYNNVFYNDTDDYGITMFSPSGSSALGMMPGDNTWFYNNVFYAKKLQQGWGSAVFDNNLYYGGATAPASETHAITSNPQFVGGQMTGDGKAICDAYALQLDSPCVGTGKTITPDALQILLTNAGKPASAVNMDVLNYNGEHDFFENPIPDQNPCIGAYQVTNSNAAPKPEVTPLLSASQDKLAIFIDNYATINKADIYGNLLYSLDNGAWIPYNSATGITEALYRNKDYSVRVKYAGLGTYTAGLPSNSATVNAGVDVTAPKPATPQLALRNGDKSIIWIDNFNTYLVNQYGHLEYSLNNGAWNTYDNSVGIHVTDEKDYTVAIRYAGSWGYVQGQTFYVASLSSDATSLKAGLPNVDANGKKYPNKVGNSVPVDSPNGIDSNAWDTGRWNWVSHYYQPYAVGDWVSFTFSGVGVEPYMYCWGNDSFCDIYIDNQLVAENLNVNSLNYSNTSIAPVSFANLTQGLHTIKVVYKNGTRPTIYAFTPLLPADVQTPELSVSGSNVLISNISAYSISFGPLEYSTDGGANWTTYNQTIAGLNNGDQIIVRYGENDEYFASGNSAAATVSGLSGNQYRRGDWVSVTDTNGVIASLGGYFNWADHYFQMTAPGDWVSFTFTGVGVEPYMYCWGSNSWCDVYIDGEIVANNLNINSSLYDTNKAPITIDTLSQGTHTVKVVFKSGAPSTVYGFTPLIP